MSLFSVLDTHWCPMRPDLEIVLAPHVNCIVDYETVYRAIISLNSGGVVRRRRALQHLCCTTHGACDLKAAQNMEIQCHG